MSALVTSQPRTKWVRSHDGLVAGVCEGLARRFDLDPWLVRVGWLIAVFAFGTGLLAYAVLAMCLPRADLVDEAERKKVLGVCLWLSRKTGIEVGLVRAITVFLALPSFGTSILVYFVLAIVAANDRESLVV